MCNWRRSLKMYSQVSQITDKILTTRKSRFIFVTLTVKNPDAEHLTETLDLMNKGFSYITSNSRTFAPAQNLKNPCRDILKPLKSHITAKKIHITRIFIAFFKSEQVILQKAILKNLIGLSCGKKAMNLDYQPSVHVKTIKETDNDKTKAVAEVAKYPTKSADLLKIEDENKQYKPLLP